MGRAVRLIAGIAAVLALGLSGCASVGIRRRGPRTPIASTARSRRTMCSSSGRHRSARAEPNSHVVTPGYSRGARSSRSPRAPPRSSLDISFRAGADVNGRTRPARRRSCSPRSFSTKAVRPSSSRHERAVRLLVDAGAEVNNTSATITRRSAYAPTRATSASCATCSSAGANVDSGAYAAHYINTPLIWPRSRATQPSCACLLRAGANADIRSTAEYRCGVRGEIHHAALAQLLLCAQRHTAPAPSARMRAALGAD